MLFSGLTRTPSYAPKLLAVEATVVNKPLRDMTYYELTALIEMQAAEELAAIRARKLQ